MLAVLASDAGDERSQGTPTGRRVVRVSGPVRQPAWTRFASPSTSARCTGTAPASAPPSPRWRPRLGGRPDVELHPVRAQLPARPTPPTRRLPLPAALAHRLWSRADSPRLDRWLGAAEVVHGTNYVVPPSRLPAVVSVYDCWFLATPSLASPAVRRAGAVLRRRRRGTGRRCTRRARRPPTRSASCSAPSASRSSTSGRSRCRRHRRSRQPPAVADGARRAAVRARARHPRAAQEPAGARRPRSGAPRRR